MKHSFKLARYRICFQTQNKVWIYKNSRLRNFYKIRSKIILKTGKKAKNFLITKNMKWTIIRRQMVPYLKKKTQFIFFYKSIFFTKQQLKNFYGGLKEYQLRTIFKNTWNKEKIFRTNIFISSLEQRLSVFLFRLRLLPTIFSCNQLIKHHGIFVNNKKITLINFRVNLGDIITIPKEQWFMFYKFLFERIRNRCFGEGLLLWRKEFRFKKLQYYQLKKKYKYIYTFRLLKEIFFQKKKYFFIKKYFFFWKKHLINKNVSFPLLNIFYYFFFKNLKKNFTKLQKSLKILRQWSNKNYFFKRNWVLFLFLKIKILLNFFQKLLLNFSQKFFHFDQFKLKKNLLQVFFEKNSILKIKKIHQIIQRNFLKGNLRWKKYLRYKKYFLFLLRKLKNQKLKIKKFKNWCVKTHWYTPNYLEINFNTLQASFIYYPKNNEIFFGFLNSFKKLISFYKERSL